MNELTSRQGEVLALVVLSIREHGRPPTLREIADALGVRRTNTAKDHLLALERKGHVRLLPGARGIQVVGPLTTEPAPRRRR